MSVYHHPPQQNTQAAKNIRNSITSLLARLKKSHPERQQYIPEQDLRKIVTQSAVLGWVSASEINPNGPSGTAERIFQSALRTFCILLEIEEENSIKTFTLALGEWGPDIKLPWPNSQALIGQFISTNSPEQKTWTEAKGNQFIGHQWKYSVPILIRGQEQRLHGKSMLPYLSEKRKKDKLFEVDFDGRYLRRSDTKDSCSQGVIKMMRKEISLRDYAEDQQFFSYKNPRQVTQHPHIIELFAYYEQNGTGNLLMPLLQGDLSDLLCRDEQLVYFNSHVQYLTQMLELSDAIRECHHIPDPRCGAIGTHNDLKPANIFLDNGRFVLGDFGIATLWPSSANYDHNNYGYRASRNAPEELQSDSEWPGQSGPKSDIFSLGTIYLELLVHMTGKAKGVADFTARRKSLPQINNSDLWCTNNGTINPAVLRKLREIRGVPGSEIRRQLVEVIASMLLEDPNDRLSAEDVVQQMKNICKDANVPLLLTGQTTPRTSSIIQQPLTYDERLANTGSGFIGQQLQAVPTLQIPQVSRCEENTASLLRVEDLTIGQQGQVKSTWKRHVQKWAATSNARLLILSSKHTNQESVLSFITAQIIKRASEEFQSSKTILLYHLCNKNKRNGEEAVNIMIQSMLRQLLSKAQYAPEVQMQDQASLSTSSSDSVDLRKMFEQGIKNLEKGVKVVCIVDGLQAYCDDRRAARTEQALEFSALLTRLASVQQQNNPQPNFKLLLTSCRSAVVNRLCGSFGISPRDTYSIDDIELDLQGLRDGFWTDHPLQWI